MQVRVIVRESEDGGYWATATSLPGCTVMGDDYDDLMSRIRRAVADCLSRDDETGEEEIDYLVEFATSA